VHAAGEKKRQWRVSEALLYGQGKECHRLRKLVKAERRKCWDSWEEFNLKLKAQGLSRVLNTTLVERVNLTIRRGDHGFATAHLVDDADVAEFGGELSVVEGLLSFWEATRLVARKFGRGALAGWETHPAAESVIHTSHGGEVTDHRWTVKEVLNLPLHA
jgi:hypothetical protein